LDPQEYGTDHETNARIKAEAWSRTAGMTAIASDGGLSIPILGPHWQSIFTNRFAGKEANVDTKIKLLLDLMSSHRGNARSSTWLESTAIAINGRTIASWAVTGPTGLISETMPEKSRISGFWVFSIWYLPDFEKVYADMTRTELDNAGDHWFHTRLLLSDFFKQANDKIDRLG
jgi:inosine/xanthosine triphosphate pyrophosphatase family protein